jgi:hypothetical protein
MAEPEAHVRIRRQMIAAAEADPRIVGLVSYGSYISERIDQWSDVDVSVFIRDADYEEFAHKWVEWAGQFGRLLLAYISWVGHPWAVYDAEPIPIRADFDLYPESRIDEVCKWPMSPVSVETALWYDGSGGRLRDCVKRLVGRSLAPDDPRGVFEQVCGDFWYESLYAYSRLERGEHWIARQAFHCRVMEPLHRLLRLEAGSVERWQANPSAVDVERALPTERLTQLARCIPGQGESDLYAALFAAAGLGYEACETMARRHGWAWPQELADRTLRILRAAVARARPA